MARLRTIDNLLSGRRKRDHAPKEESVQDTSNLFLTDKEMRKLTRTELLEMLLAEARRARDLETRLADAEEKLARRQLDIQEAGSLAEACLKLNGVFEAAQAACRQY